MAIFAFFLISGLVTGVASQTSSPDSNAVRLQCSVEVSACEQRFTSAVKSAGYDVQANCLAASTLQSCLSQREALTACASSQGQIDQLKQTYADQINSTACASNESVACAQGLANCSDAYNKNNAGTDAAAQCQRANTYISCLNGVACNSANYRLQIAKVIGAITQMMSSPGSSCTLSASVTSQATDCNTDVMNCESTFKKAINASGDDVAASCTAASAFLSCLDTKDNAPECKSVKPVIKSLRDNYADQISAKGCKELPRSYRLSFNNKGGSGAAGSGPVLCTKDIQNCQQQFVVDDTKAGDDNTKACQAGEALANCLTSIQGRPECGGAKALIDSIRGAYHDQINTQGCAAINRPAQTQCHKDVVACEQTFQAAVQAAPTNAIAQCNAGVVFMACLDSYDHKVECLAAQSAISSMRAIFSKQISSAGCGNGVKPTVTACQGDVLNCVKTFTTAVSNAPNSVDAQCSAGAALTKCFDDKDKAPECAAVKDTIADLRNTFSSQIRTAGCAGNADPNNPKIRCSLQITDCEETLQTQVTDAGTDVKASCLAGANLETCLKHLESLPDCSGSKSTVDQMRDLYKQQIDQTACVSKAAMACASGVQTCSQTFHTNFQTQTSDDGRCKYGRGSRFKQTSNTYITCLNGVKCSKSFEKQLTTAVMMVQQMLSNNTATCDLVQLHGAASGVAASALTYIMGVLVMLYAWRP